MSFYTDDSIRCPDCPPRGKRKLRPELECVESNYSGCAVDMAVCPECGHGFSIAYTVKSIDRAEGWDIQSREEREKEEAERKMKQEESLREQRREQYVKLREEFGDEYVS